MADTGPTDTGAPPGTSTAAASAPPASGGPDWTDQVTGLLVDTVDKVRSRTTGPILNVAHAAVYAVVALIIALPVLVLLTLGVVRLLNWAIPGDVWIVYAIMASIFWITGLLLWGARNQPS